MVGKSLHKQLTTSGYKNIITANRNSLDLTNQKKTNDFFSKNKPNTVVICAAKVGGILANNTYRGEFLYNNLQIATNIIQASHNNSVKKLIFLGSSCIYPKECKQPIKEEYLLNSSLEYTNEPYAIAKIAGLKMCENYYKQYGDNFYSVMPCNLFGENDNFDLKTSHVLPALIRKAHEAKINDKKFIEVWGSGKPLREFLHTHDLSRALEMCINSIDAKDIYSQGISHLNIGSDDEITIKELTEIICRVVGFDGEIKFDNTKPDGTMRKKMDNSRIKKLNFQQNLSLEDGLKKEYNAEKENWNEKTKNLWKMSMH